MRQRPGENQTVYDLLKRLFDIVGAIVGLVVLSPVFAVVSLAVKLDSPGPVLFRQRRIGRGGEPFTLLKFRTMATDVDESIHREYMAQLVEGKADARLNDRGESVYLLDDPRVTRVGRILRKASIDEFPNLLNVLKGEMSLVGPRPPIPYEVEMYDERSKRRLSVKPGVTGLAQVEGRGALQFGEMVELDLRYIQERSFGLDLKIVLRTIPSVLMKRGV